MESTKSFSPTEGVGLNCFHLSRVQLIDVLLTSHRYPVAKPTRRPSWSLTTIRSPLANPLLTKLFCGTALLLWKLWRKTPSDCTVTGPLSCTFPTQLPFFSLEKQSRKSKGSILSIIQYGFMAGVDCNGSVYMSFYLSSGFSSHTRFLLFLASMVPASRQQSSSQWEK